MSQIVAQPISGSRIWATGIAPNPRGDWNYILQSWEAGSAFPTEWVVLDLETGNQAIFTAPRYTTTNVVIRTTNGRLWFPGHSTHLTYYDPVLEDVVDLGPLIDPLGSQSTLYRLSIGPDGKVYAGTQCATGLPIILQIDPVTLAVVQIGAVGELPRTVPLSYAYYVFADPPWVYSAVGQNPWQLSARNMVTGEQRILATRGGAGFMSFTARSRGITVVLAADGVLPAETWWCLDGNLFGPFTGANQNLSPYTPRDTRPLAGTVTGAPTIDTARLAPESDGRGFVRWQLAGGPQRETPYEVDHVYPITLESLVALPDGDLLGNGVQYHGFFRYRPSTQALATYGTHHPSQPVLAVLDGKVYIAGYPNCQLYCYDPEQLWTSAEGQESSSKNPALLGVWGVTELARTHYALFLVPSASGRVYMAGRLERDGTGAGIGSYRPSTLAFAGHNTNLAELLPSGLAACDDVGRVVMATRRRVSGSAVDSVLIVYDQDLVEIARQTILAGLASCGLIWATGGGEIVGIMDTPAAWGSTSTSSIYRWNISTGTLVEHQTLAAHVEAVTRKNATTLIAVVDGDFVEIAL